MGLVTVAVMACLFLAWRIGNAPISLGFAIPAIEAALSPSDGSFAVQLKGFRLRRDQLDFVLEAEGLSLYHLDKAAIQQAVPFATMPIARLSLSVNALLQDGILAANRIVASGWKMSANRGQEGIELNFSDDMGNAGEGLTLTALRHLLREDERLRYLKSVELTDLTFRINDPILGIAWQTSGAWMQLVNDREGLSWGGRMVVAAQSGDLTKVVQDAGTIRWNVSLPASGQYGGFGEAMGAPPDQATLKVDLFQLEPSLIIELLPRLRSVISWEGRVSGSAVTKFSLMAIPTSVRFDLGVGAGRMAIPLTGGSLVFDAADINGQVDLTRRILNVRNLSIRHDKNKAQLSGEGMLRPDGSATVKLDANGLNLAWLGRIVPGAAALAGADLAIATRIAATVSAQGAIDTATAELSTAGGKLNLPKKLLEPLKIGKSSLHLSVSEAGRFFLLDDLSLTLPRDHSRQPIAVTVAGKARIGGQGVLKIVTADLDAPDLKRLWPIGVGEGARVWVVDQVHKGSIPQAEIDVTFRLPDGPGMVEPEDIRIDGRMPLRDVDLTYWPPLPNATGMSANAHISEKHFEANVTSGTSGGVKVRGGRLTITGIDKGKGYENATLSFDLAGSLSNLMTILDRPPLRFARFLELPPSQLGGRIAGTLSAKFPPIADLSLNDIEIGAVGTAEGVAIPQAAFRQDLKDGKFDFKVDKAGLSLTGNGAMVGTPLNLEGDLRFAASAKYRSKFRLRATLGDEARVALGFKSFPFSRQIVAGPVGVEMTATESKADGTAIKVAADLTKARLALPMIGWRSLPGEFAVATAQVRVVDGRLRRIESFRVKASQLTLAGDATWPIAEGAGPTVRLSEFRLGSGTDLALVAKPDRDAGYRVAVAGKRLDVRPMIKDLTDAKGNDDGGDKAGSPIAVKLKIGSVAVGDGPSIEKLTGEIQIGDSEIKTISLMATTLGGGKALLDLKSDKNITLSASDAGALLTSFGITERLEQGALVVQGKLQSSPQSLRGKLTLKGGELKDAPFMVRLLSGGDIDRPKVARHWSIDQLNSEFSLGSGVLTLENGRVFGGELGITFRGWLDLIRGKLEVGGAIVPAYSVNRMLGAIPLLGQVLTGGEGLFAANYRATGSLGEPRFAINPLTALAPGMLRKLFDGELSQPPQP